MFISNPLDLLQRMIERAVLWVSVLATLPSGGVAPPDVSTIQSPYEREAASGSSLHDKGLRVIEAVCGDASEERYLCQVTFLSNDDPEQRLYFDVVGLVRNGGGWTLESGLCKRQ